MTKDPPRLLSADSDAEALERALLVSVQRVDVPPEAKQIAWEGIATGIAAGAAGSAAATSVSALGSKGAIASALSSPFAKLALAIALIAASGGGWWLHRRAVSPPTAAVNVQPPPSIASKPLPPMAADPAPPAPPSVDAPSDPIPAKVTPRSHPHARPPARGAGRLAAESALLQDARARLRNRDVDGAANALAQLQYDFADGALKQEREVLAIELFQARGQTDAAKRAARTFVANYPNSPHCASLQPLLSDR